MTKWELIRVALTELTKQWSAGDNREYFDSLPEPGFDESEVCIKWNPVHKRDAAGYSNIPKAMTITRKHSGMFVCTIHDTSSTFAANTKQEKTITDKRFFYMFTKLNKEFNALRGKIVQYKRTKENSAFLNDLVKVFPRTLDGALLGDDYDE